MAGTGSISQRKLAGGRSLDLDRVALGKGACFNSVLKAVTAPDILLPSGSLVDIVFPTQGAQRGGCITWPGAGSGVFTVERTGIFQGVAKIRFEPDGNEDATVFGYFELFIFTNANVHFEQQIWHARKTFVGHTHLGPFVLPAGTTINAKVRQSTGGQMRMTQANLFVLGPL